MPCKTADPGHASALCASKDTIAALNHLRGRESILPLPQPASSSVAEFTLRDLVVTHKRGPRAALVERSRAKSLGLVGRDRCWVKAPHTSAWYHCYSRS